MNTSKRYRFPPDIISYAVWLYFRFNLGHRDIEDPLAEQDLTVSREAIRLWCIKFGTLYANRLKRKHLGYGDTFFIEEVFLKINGKQHYLWRAVDQESLPHEVLLGMVRWLMCIFRLAVMVRQRNGSSGNYYVDTKANPERSLPINCEAME